MRSRVELLNRLFMLKIYNFKAKQLFMGKLITIYVMLMIMSPTLLSMKMMAELMRLSDISQLSKLSFKICKCVSVVKVFFQWIYSFLDHLNVKLFELSLWQERVSHLNIKHLNGSKKFFASLNKIKMKMSNVVFLIMWILYYNVTEERYFFAL